jgi:YggT family protein
VISSLLSEVIRIYSYIVLASVIVSWVAPQSNHPALQLLRSVTEPVFDKVRRVVPAMGGLDLSPMIVLIALHFLQRII